MVCPLALALLLPLTAQPYVRRLDSEAIREAFELGRRRDEVTGLFLARYVQTFLTPAKGPYIGSIELLTPYAQVVYAAKDDMTSDTEFDAESKFGTTKFSVFVRIRVYWPPSNALSSERGKNIWEQFRVVVSQKALLTPTKKELIPHPLDQRGLPRFDCTDMQLEFSVAQISSEVLAVHATSPDGQQVEAKFDLAHLQ